MMIVYRLAYRNFIDDTSGVGARLYGGRWNARGIPCMYASEHISLALLEKFIHARGAEEMEGVMLMKVEMPEQSGVLYHTDATKLKNGWEQDIEYSQWLGNQLLRDDTILAFSVPSAIVPAERNVIINPGASAFDRVKFSEPVVFPIDQRLLKRLP